MAASAVTQDNGRTFDYNARLVEANLNYLVRDLAASPDVPISASPQYGVSRWWTGGPVLDQGAEGACVGFGVSQEAASSPVRVQGVTDQTASTVYRRAKQIDEWEGVDYDGTSVRAGMMVGREKGWWDSFYWCKGMDDLRIALDFGPVVIGVDWLQDMYDTDENGIVDIGGRMVGGHCLLITGYSPNYSGKGKVARWRNSWSKGYGKNGNGYIRWADLDRILFRAGNEAAVAVNRKLARP
jgi:hypothetical protein